MEDFISEIDKEKPLGADAQNQSLLEDQEFQKHLSYLDTCLADQTIAKFKNLNTEEAKTQQIYFLVKQSNAYLSDLK